MFPTSRPYRRKSVAFIAVFAFLFGAGAWRLVTQPREAATFSFA